MHTRIIDLIAHRVYGMRTILVDAHSDGAGADVDPRFDPHASGRLSRRLQRVIDTSQGTSRKPADIEAMFSANPSYEYPGGSTVNGIFASAGIVFRLVNIVDTMIESHAAVFARDLDIIGTARHNNRPNAINLYFFKEIENGYGKALNYVETDVIFFCAVSDTHRTTSPIEQFKRTIVTTAHELGHVLGLPHVALAPDNVMATGSFDRRVNFSRNQDHILNSKAVSLAADEQQPTIDPMYLEEPREDWREWQFDPFDEA